MYDQVSLSGLLESAGFTRITRQTHDASLSAEPSIRELDSDAEGNVRKPDSLFMEAVKPQTPLPVPRVAMFFRRVRISSIVLSGSCSTFMVSFSIAS